MMRLSTRRLAQLAIGVQFLALLRTLGEYFHLRYIHGPVLTITAVEPFVTGALLAAVCTAGAVLCYYLGKYRMTIGVAVGTVVLLFVYKLVAVG